MNYKKELKKLFIKEYIPNNKKYSIHEIIKNKKIVLYGFGSGCITFFTIVINRYKNIKIDKIIDKNPSKKTYNNIPVIKPEELNIDIPENYVIIITIGKKEYYKEIVNTLKNLKLNNIIFVNDIYEYHLHFTNKEIEKKGFYFYLENKEKILKTFNYFKDDLSKKIFIKYLKTHIYKIPQVIPNGNIKNQYFPYDIKLNYNRFINCGAYNGDTIKQLNQKIGKVETIVCFEPDKNNYSKLIDYLNNNKENIAEYILTSPCGVYSENKILYFDEGNNTNSRVNKNGNVAIQVIKLDDVLLNYSPTLIQMDIEGSELEALYGAKKIIKENIPDLSICVYHTPEHMWEIPLFIKSLYGKYQLYLRNYTGYISETVLYAVKGE
ncbi:hypothetical protein OSSY52_07570 [Tepiditoga spiralis]|uniref:Methyltransferase FkbM domain-containing protein n=1 Tax=Tepiditoga spiralis TaxID=2108365 RepID=A0A7G1G5P8_9BACT|nr:FkbM family methyltransferase [Tepiditoga spiralis]BBE30616.1 hypothetical protein OSSY52_07570 [Tepiditoga spiralis]